MEKMNFDTAPVQENLAKEKLSWKENVGKVLKLSGVPIAFAMFLASCGGGEKAPSQEKLSELKEKGEAVAVSSDDVAGLEAIIQKAKDEGKTAFYFEGDKTIIDVDTVENFVELTKIAVDNHGIKSAMGVMDGTIKYNEYLGVNGSASIAQFHAEKNTGIVTGAVVDQGTYDEGYGVNEKGEITGSKDVGLKAVKGFSEDVQIMKDKLEIK